METKKKNLTGLIASTVVGGIVLTYLLNRRSGRTGKPTIIDNVKNFERKLYKDGERRALSLKKIKLDAEVAVAANTNEKGSTIQ